MLSRRKATNRLTAATVELEDITSDEAWHFTGKATMRGVDEMEHIHWKGKETEQSQWAYSYLLLLACLGSPVKARSEREIK